MSKILIDAEALREVLIALNGPDHMMRELQVLRKPPFDKANPINRIIADYEDSGNHVGQLDGDIAREMCNALQTFVKRVEDGEVRSVKTYKQFKDILNRLEVKNAEG